MASKGVGRPKIPRMTPAMFHILLAVADEEKHGYAIKREILERSEGKIKLGPGSLYWAIGRLEEAGLIAETSERPDPELDDARRRYYRLTRSGRAALERELETWAEVVAYARSKNIVAYLAAT